MSTSILESCSHSLLEHRWLALCKEGRLEGCLSLFLNCLVSTGSLLIFTPCRHWDVTVVTGPLIFCVIIDSSEMHEAIYCNFPPHEIFFYHIRNL